MVPDKSVKCRGQVHIALGMKQEDKWGDIAGLMSGTGRAEKALHSGGGAWLQARECGEPPEMLRIEMAHCHHQSLLWFSLPIRDNGEN